MIPNKIQAWLFEDNRKANPKIYMEKQRHQNNFEKET